MRPIQCDKCGTPAPDLRAVLANPHGRKGGLNAMGWFCRGGKCTCPECKAAKGAQENGI